MFGQLDTVRHPVDVGLGLLLVMATAIASDAAAGDIALVALNRTELFSRRISNRRKLL